jgi:hypothetical protein
MRIARARIEPLRLAGIAGAAEGNHQQMAKNGRDSPRKLPLFVAADNAAVPKDSLALLRRLM